MSRAVLLLPSTTTRGLSSSKPPPQRSPKANASLSPGSGEVREPLTSLPPPTLPHYLPTLQLLCSIFHLLSTLFSLSLHTLPHTSRSHDTDEKQHLICIHNHHTSLSLSLTSHPRLPPPAQAHTQFSSNRRDATPFHQQTFPRHENIICPLL